MKQAQNTIQNHNQGQHYNTAKKVLNKLLEEFKTIIPRGNDAVQYLLSHSVFISILFNGSSARFQTFNINQWLVQDKWQKCFTATRRAVAHRKSTSYNAIIKRITVKIHGRQHLISLQSMLKLWVH